MAIEPLRLDDLAWPAMVESIRRRIPAASNGRWTLHAPVDPGVTLLELFAALLEQRVYWLDQTPDPLLRAMLALLGAAPRKTAVASTVLELRGAPFREVAEKTEMRLDERTPYLVVSTDQPLTLLPVERLALEIGGRDRTQDLLHGRLLRLFPADGQASEVRLVLWLAKRLPANAPAASFGLLVELDVPERIPPSWDQEAVEAPPPAQVLWEYPVTGSTGKRPFPADRVEDGTGGLRRSGLVRLPVPGDWRAEEAGPDGPFGYAVHLRVERATFSAPPRLAGVTPNAVVAHHRRRSGPYPVRLDGPPLSGREISLADLPPLEETVVVRLQERDHGRQEWKPTADLSVHGPADRVFEVDRRLGVLRFGNGLNGRQPVLAPGVNGEVEHEVGGGLAGNVGARLSWQGEGGLKAVNLVSARGGAEPQTLAATRDEVAAELRRPTRAVLRRDFEELVRTTPGVAIRRARAAVGLHPAHPCRLVPGAVTVFVVPDVPREEEDEELRESAFVAAPVPDPGALDAVRSRLDAARLVTTEVFVAPPRYRAVALRVGVEADPPDPVALERRLEEHLRQFLDPLTGGTEGNGWPFGEPLRPSALLREAQEALERDGDVSRVAIGLDGEEPSEDCKDVPIGEHDLVHLADLRMDLRRAAPVRGGLR